LEKAKLESHLAELEAHHTALDKQIAEGYSMYLDDLTLSKTKQEKLYTKQRINIIKAKLNETRV
jgi:hypothetical protein